MHIAKIETFTDEHVCFVRVTAEDGSDDAINDFLDDRNSDRGGGGWFGRRR